MQKQGAKQAAFTKANPFIQLEAQHSSNTSIGFMHLWHGVAVMATDTEPHAVLTMNCCREAVQLLPHDRVVAVCLRLCLRENRGEVGREVALLSVSHLIGRDGAPGNSRGQDAIVELVLQTTKHSQLHAPRAYLVQLIRFYNYTYMS